jgi:hypothetical protein
MDDVVTSEASEDGKVSARKRAANRRNAQKSTGPRTPEGEAKVRLNALRHGLRSRQVVIPGLEQPWDFTVYLARLEKAFKPKGPLEVRQVREIGEADWQHGRWLRAEATAFALAADKARAEAEKKSGGFFGGLDDDEGEEEPRHAYFVLPSRAELRTSARYEAAIRRRDQAVRELARLQRERRTRERRGAQVEDDEA